MGNWPGNSKAQISPLNIKGAGHAKDSSDAIVIGFCGRARMGMAFCTPGRRGSR